MDITRVNQSDICPVHVFLGEERLWVYSSRLILSLDSKPACVCFCSHWESDLSQCL